MQLVQLLLQLGILLAVALVGGRIARMLRQPAVIGEIVGGIFLGPSLLGTFAPDAFAQIFPQAGVVASARDAFLKLGMVFFLFVAGLEVRLESLRGKARGFALTGLFGGIVPFVLGLTAVFAFPHFWNDASQSSLWTLALVMGSALSISAIPVIARILMDLGLMREKFGATVMISAAANDLIGWCIFALVLAQFRDGSMPLLPVVGKVILFIALVLGFGLKAGPWLLRFARRTFGAPAGYIGFLCALVLLVAAAGEWAGVHAVFGSFLLGVALAQGMERAEEVQVREVIRHFSLSFFAPLFFVSIGLTVNFAQYFRWDLVLALLLVATAGKVLGASMGARLSGFSLRESWAVGFAMNARGAMGIVLAQVAFATGMIGPSLYVAFVAMAVFTSILSAPLLKALLRQNS